MRRRLIETGWTELPVDGRLQPIHADPFDRLMSALAGDEGLTLITRDPVLARHPGPIRPA